MERPYNEWLAQGYHGQMKWLEQNVDKRLDPTLLFDGAKTIISLVAWYHSSDYQDECGVSRYATGRDYHKVLKKEGRKLVDFIRELAGPIEARVFVDSAPVMEREWGKRAGLGWIGKNGCLIQPRKGSWFFLAEIILDYKIPPDPPELNNLCGSRTRCIRSCPTGALLGEGLLDANRCISYLTIELKDKKQKDDDLNWDKWFFGCDICQEVCPWNRQALNYQFDDLKPRKNTMEIKQLLDQDIGADELADVIAGTPLIRTGVHGLKANLMWLNHSTDQKESH